MDGTNLNNSECLTCESCACKYESEESDACNPFRFCSRGCEVYMFENVKEENGFKPKGRGWPSPK